MFVFLGRLAPQKGVHLLLDCVGPLVRATAGRAHVLASPYARRCAAQMAQLRASVGARSFRCGGGGAFVSAAADFGVMPSLCEPSGLVGEEFLAAGTPLVCAATGGMRGRVSSSS
ncbi:hypothetical protein EMIHUDRAFT_255459 [Emiliania huxleyi CCMP1516]|uniref:Glycosyl transferase family 1 domain-containing protein n=2 Tax=Emiliania huxleyi TaxID=2903 RepID=A0A0D3JAU5_EMIH1|nr:hypothetical protein EMIHUDRAFT_255459 [Emiliania huxleyi CCMP1516]EOD20630.1 hypothetical protein EMIHUDRAFT_255459 [Emiliania huxleyi CCMP1516]|eukprot:XP_005773059.1 hypothetical protein EMIHUDRAFT_255459 [Emiliania huxleyi CCMP1516]